MPPKPNTAELEKVAELRVALRRFQAATDEITSRHGLTPRQYDLLAVLHAPGRGAQLASELSEVLAISRNAMTELISRAEQAGLVERTADDADSRRKPIRPTRAGTARFTQAVVELMPERERLFALLRPAATIASELGKRR